MSEFHNIKKFYQLGKELQLRDILAILKASKKLSFKKGDVLINQNSVDNTIFLIRKGLVRCYNVNEKGEEITFQLIPEYQLMGNTHFYLFQEPSKFCYEALEATKVYSINFDILQSIISDNLKLESNRKFFFQKIIKRVFLRVETFVLLSPEERYLQYIKDFPNIINRAPDKYIANILGITPVSLSRIRKRIASKK